MRSRKAGSATRRRSAAIHSSVVETQKPVSASETISAFTPTRGGFAHGAELTAFIRDRWDVCIVGAAYPEKHLEAPDLETDLGHLKEKVASGAQVLITQLFFEAETYFTFVHRARAAGITVPIVPGIMPVTNVSQIEARDLGNIKVGTLASLVNAMGATLSLRAHFPDGTVRELSDYRPGDAGRGK